MTALPTFARTYRRLRRRARRGWMDTGHHQDSYAEITLDDMVARMRALGDELPRVMPDLAVACRAYLLEHYAAGQDPYGQPWPLTKRKPRVAHLTGKTLQVGYRGAVLIMRVIYFEAMHSRGLARGEVQRLMIPSDLPNDLATELSSIVEARLSEVLAA